MQKHMKGIIIVFTFLSLAFFECGIVMEDFWMSGGAWGDFYMEYTEAGAIASPLLIRSIPAGIVAAFLIRLVLCIKRRNNMLEFCFDCVCALLGMGMGIGLLLKEPYAVYRNPVFLAGEQFMAHLIETFDWMSLPIP